LGDPRFDRRRRRHPGIGRGGILDFIGKNPTLVGSVLQLDWRGGSQVNSKDLQKQVNAQIDLRSARRSSLMAGPMLASRTRSGSAIRATDPAAALLL
jgi:hypothetical protein